ncbi:septation protein SepH [Luteococcus sp.]|uniref:septation protein SepH n=1 Tax=Luteococcus sp. TaxID=1969402 RepID=UPI00373596D9
MSSLSPREIQTRIRSGASLEDVAREAELPVEKVEPFAAPVLAEREHVAGTALQCPVRRRGETGSVRAMRAVLGEKLHGTGLSVDDLDWDAWRNEDRRWTVVGRYQNDGIRHEALFVFDQRARFSVAVNDRARELIGEAVPEQSRTLSAPEAAGSDAEPTVNLDDELAIVRALQDRRTRQAASEVQALTQLQPEAPRPAEPTPQHTESEAVTPEAVTPEAVTPDAIEDEEPEDYSPAEFQEVDGLYDFVPKNTSDMDVLYEMLSSFAEDSVNIYAGLANPVTQEPAGDEGLDEDLEEEQPSVVRQLHPEPAPAVVEREEPISLEEAPQFRTEDQPHLDAPVRAVDLDQREETLAESQSSTVSLDQARILAYQQRSREQAEAAQARAAQAEPATTQPAAALAEQMQQDEHSVEVAPNADTPVDVETAPAAGEATPAEQPTTGPVVTTEGTVTSPEAMAPRAQVPEPVQPSQEAEQLADEAASQRVSVTVVESRAVTVTTQETVEVPTDGTQENAQPKAPTPRKPRPGKKRASVPSWDEIMFGGPTKKTD